MLLLMLAILLPVPLSLGEVNDTMFVMPEGQISDFTARLTLARLLSMQDDRLLEAEAEYRTLMADDQANVAVLLELSRLLKRLDKTTEAAAILQTIFEQLKNNPLPDRQLAEIYMEQADLETGLGHVEPCRRLYRKALELTDNDDEVRLRFADQMNMWGDFHEIEKIFRALLNEQPDNHEIRLKLAGTLASMERFAEAEGIYLALLQENSDRTAEILLGLADVSFKENNLPATIARVDKLLQHAGPVAKHSEDILLAGLRLKGDALFKLERYQEALQIYTELAGSKPGMIEGLVSQGRVYIRLQEMEKARDVFHRLVTSYPDNLEAGLSLAILNADDPLSPLETIKSTKPTAAMKLVVLGRLYGVQGLYNAAAASFKAALDRDPQCFPASLGLAESLAADNRFEQAVDLLQQLQQTYPDNHKLNITMARVLAWSKQYNKAILVYDTIHALQPDNPVPVTEKARTAVWGKKMAEAQTTYKTLWKTPVDQQLFSRLAAIDSHEADELSQAMARLNNTVDNDSIYTGYEQVAAKLDTLRSSLSDEQADRVHRAVLELQPAYRIQKSASLESRAKKLSWDKRFTPSMKTYEELLSFQPGNQEALFDYAQVQCALGMCDREKDTYEHLLNINPWHSLAQTALDRQRARGNPGIAAGQSYWEEEGRGELSQIARHRMDLILDLPLFCRYHLRFLGHHWQEEPKHRGGHYTAGGQTIEFNGVINPYLSGAVAWTGKDYSRDTIPDRETGHGRLSLNLQNYARVNLGFERTDELYNDFGIRHGTQADTWSLGLQSSITRKLELRGNARFLDYNDNNQGRHYSLAASYDVTDHPRIFKVTLTGESRDTDHKNIFSYRNTTLIDITYPYWTPQNYTGGTVIFEWYHDLSKLFFCGAEQHYYDIRLNFGTNSENNPSAQLEAEWHYEFYHHWLILMKGLAHASGEWDALAFWTTLRYRF